MAGAIIAPGFFLVLALLIVGAIKLCAWLGLSKDDIGALVSFGGVAIIGAGWGWYFGGRK